MLLRTESTSQTDEPGSTGPGAGLHRDVYLAASAVVAVLLAVAGRYGFHRDELYFVVAGRRLDWGYVDQPPLTPLIARISETVGGVSPVAIRILPALAIGGVMLLTALITRRFGGGGRAQLFAAVAAGGTGFALAVGHLMSTATFDYFLWTLAIWLLCGLLDGADQRRWVALGFVVGIALQNKLLIGLFGVAVLVSLLVSSQRRILAGVWPWVGAALAGVIALPTLVWQLSNDFPQLEMAGALAARSDGPVVFVLEQVGLLSIVLAVPAAVGWWRLLRLPEMSRWRPIAVVFGLLFAFFLATGGKSYYVAPMYPALIAAGSLWFEQLGNVGGRVMVGAAAVGIFIGLLISLPLLSAGAVSKVDVTGELGETVGWPELVDQVAAVYDTMPAELRASTAIFTGSYGEAGAIDVLGPDRNLPPASSGHNNYWLWGPPEHHGPIIGVGYVDAALRLVCSDVDRVGVVSNPYGVENEEAGLPLFVCLAPQRQLADVWDDIKHYD